MAELPTKNEEPNPARSPQVDPDLGFFQDSELYVVLLGAVFGAFATVALASLLLKSMPVMVADGLAGAYLGGIRLRLPHLWKETLEGRIRSPTG